ncbi:MAG TPA: VOC family protein [Mobilitalea sp.]|nr:VOC family protein [Mobilitalea sp.]
MFLAEVCIETNDVIKLAGFYRSILGIESYDKDEVHQVVVNEDVSLTVYNDGQPKNNQNQNISLAFTVDNVDTEYERLLKLGVTILEPPTTRPWGARNMHFCDPDGNHIYFRSFPEA